MSDLDDPAVSSPASAQQAVLHEGASAAPQTAGSLLRQAREAAGLHIAALAVALKVPVKKLEALEADRLDLLPDAVFVRALASSVCRTLKMDGSQVLALLPQTGKPRLDYQHTSINTPFRSPSDGPGPSLWAQVSRPAVLAGLLLLLGALVLILLPAVQQQNATAQSGAESAPVAGVAAAPASPPVAASPGQDGATPPAAAVADSPATAADAAPAAPALAALAALPASAANAAVASPVASVSPSPSGQATTGVIVFTAKAESWVEVTDAKGVVVLRRTLAAGEAAGASGTLPLAAVVGRADATQVQVRGRPFDLAAVSRDNVARFEVK